MQRRGAITELVEVRQRDDSPDVRSCPSIPRRLGQHLATIELLTLGSALDVASYAKSHSRKIKAVTLFQKKCVELVFIALGAFRAWGRNQKRTCISNI